MVSEPGEIPEPEDVDLMEPEEVEDPAEGVIQRLKPTTTPDEADSEDAKGFLQMRTEKACRRASRPSLARTLAKLSRGMAKTSGRQGLEEGQAHRGAGRR